MPAVDAGLKQSPIQTPTQTNPTPHHWYVVRLRPGSQREAPLRLGAPVDRQGENRAERDLRDAGFDVYFPRMRKECRSRRTHKVVVRALPLFTGYAFVSATAVGGTAVEDVEAVAQLLRGAGGRPVPVSGPVIARLRQAEADMEFDDTREARITRREQGRTRRESVKLLFPAGRRAQIASDNPQHPMAGFYGHVQSVTGRGMVRLMIEIFGGQVPCEIDPSLLEAA